MALTLNVMSTRLTEPSCSNVVRVVVDSRLHGLEDMVGIQEVILSPQVWHHRQGIMRCGCIDTCFQPIPTLSRLVIAHRLAWKER